ncbi:hypothetical protein [Psychromicrobium sp. YIM B11713]|uniref:hypothetical protein n=1 Tax=Psychromicrobium sp. YIM B11713 TaxID=3145233 RepID=UPI00374F84DB
MERHIEKFSGGALTSAHKVSGAQTTENLAFNAVVLSREDFPALSSLFADRQGVEAEAVVRHYRLVRRIGHQAFELMTAWGADRQGIVVAELRRALCQENGRFHPVGDWHIYDKQLHSPVDVPTRRAGEVSVGPLISSEETQDKASVEKQNPTHRSGYEAALYLPGPVRSTMLSVVPQAEVYCGQLVQFQGSGQIRQRIDLLRVGGEKATVVIAERSVASFSDAKQSLALTPWKVTQITYALGTKKDEINR